MAAGTPATAFHSEQREGREIVTLRRPARKGLIPFSGTRESEVPFDEWTAECPPGAVMAMSRLLQAWADDEVDRGGSPAVFVVEGRARLSPAFVAGLSEPEALALGLPPATRLSLQLASRGGLQDQGFRIDTRWTRPGGIGAHVAISGARIRTDGREWRIAEPLYSTILQVEAVNAAPADESRHEAMAGLRIALGEQASERIDADGYIERLRLSYAAAFSLDLKVEGGGFDFDPVLFSRQRAAEADDTGRTLDEAADGLLPPQQHRSFTARFRGSPTARATYLLNDGAFVFIDPSLSRALGVVRERQQASLDDRKAFVRNPRRAIREALGVTGDAGEGADTLFVETQQFSERVSGIDVWRKPVLPWIKPKPNSWLPESFGLKVGDGDEAAHLDLSPEQASEALAACEAAIERGDPTLQIGDAEVPATEQTRSALAGLVEFAAAAARPDAGEAPPPAGLQRFFLQVRDNLEEVDYAPLGTVDRPVDAEAAALPAALRTQPKAHQRTGYDWLVANWRSGAPGALLADDMGLGKTYQALAFLAWLRTDAAPDRPVLIVAPTGLLANWQAEIGIHLSEGVLGPVVRAYGDGLRTFRSAPGRDIDTGASRLDTAEWGHAGVVLTTYETLRDYHMSFARLPFSAIVYDEIQKLKNPASQVTRAAKTLNARFQLAMTGTPVENRLQDLWSILDVVWPGLLGSSRAFETAYPASDRTALKQLNDLLTKPDRGRPAILLRRMKDEVVDGLPAKNIIAVPQYMPPAQAAAYESVLLRAMAVQSSGERGRMLEVLHALRGVSLHPRAPETAAVPDAYREESARLRVLFATLDAIAAKGEKALVFCESLAMQAFIAVEIKRRYGLDHEVARIHGGVAGDARQRAVDTFQSRPTGFDAMVLSPKAGGVGITLTRANHVIHLSRWWNPAVEDQATDRAYRIGQTRDVTVYLPQAVHPDPAIRASSFDLKLDALMRSKRQLSRDLLVPPEGDSDAGDLFDAVVGGSDTAAGKPVAATASASAQTRAQDEAVEAARGAAAGSALPVASAPAPPAPAPPAATPAPAASPPTVPLPPDRPMTQPAPAADKEKVLRRVVFRPGASRDYAIFQRHLSGEKLTMVKIRDPFACATPANRGNLIDFVKLLQGAAVGIDVVSITCWDAETARPEGRESNADQRRDLETRWEQRVGRLPRAKMSPVSGRQVREFHDRFVEATTASGRRLIWDLGRGVDGVMSSSKECVVVFTEE
ncbi:hypothetical protein COC42_05975 [Sphingomonas spermidinifaciens]|uniref:ATP-dependent helicase n=1 Tax=Sphingomonas spermidinifaciens TaxID=1141889 RepID=A0A2A4B8B2_9SPHN|nr:DEAD/DEAH box helicase [Sphingomonas spermidinifaciens]PCD03876.1 hypothetical protein COC42_05975 [Sphingomonas spermidinifaciens]